MDLSIKDVAELLNVSETTVRRWVADGKIPVYKIHGKCRFSRNEVERWVMNHKLGHANNGNSPFNTSTNQKTSSAKAQGGSQKFSLYRALHKGIVLKDIHGATKEDVLRRSTKLLSQKLKLDHEVLAEMLLDRERLHPTALNNGIAVPHAREFHLNPMHDVVAILFPEKPIPYGALDGKPVNTLIFLFACNDKRHLHLLAKIAHLSSQASTLELFHAHPSKDKLLSYVHAWESSIPEPSEE